MNTPNQPGAPCIDVADVTELLNVANVLEGGATFIKTAGRVATISSVVISIYPLEPTKHKMPHFHARFNNEESASYAIETGELLAGALKSSRHRAVLEWRRSRVSNLMAAWTTAQNGVQPQKIAATVEPAGPSSPPNLTAAGVVGRYVMLELDDFVRKIRQMASLGGHNLSDIDAACQQLSSACYDIAKKMCES